MHPSSDHPDFTALALGEHLHGAPEPEILQALRSAPTGPAEAEAVRRTAERLAAAFHREPLPAPDPTLRAVILAATPESLAQRFAGTSPPTTRTNRRTRPWLRPLAACAAITLATTLFLQRQRPQANPSNPAGNPSAEFTEPTGFVRSTPLPRPSPAQPRKRPDSAAPLNNVASPIPQPSASTPKPAPARPAPSPP
ncbi:MAG: hypothetical protein ACK5CW_05945, partial [Verrucomicrobiota bacterium]